MRSSEPLDRNTGQTLILVALLLTAMMVVAAIVLDFSVVRADRQQNRSAADAAVTAGLRSLDGGTGVPWPWQGACVAYRFLVVNSPEMSSITGSWKTAAGGPPPVPDPCPVPFGPTPSDPCVANDPDTWAWFDGTADGGRIKVDIKAGYDISSETFPGDPLIPPDPGDPAQGHCDNLAVIIKETQEPGFGVLANSWTSFTSQVRSVGRAVIGDDGDVPVALLLLERNDCRVINIDGSNARVISRGFGDRPGLIHADSLGNGADCGKILEGNFSSNWTSPDGTITCTAPCPRILAEDAETPVGSEAEGIIGVYAMIGPGGVPGNASTPCPTTVEAQPGGCPEGRPLIGRAPVDARYLTPMGTLRAEATTRVNWTPAIASANGFTILDCNFNPLGPGSSADQKLFINCADANTAPFNFPASNAEVVFNGDVTVGGGPGSVLSIADPRKVYIKGSVKLTRSFDVNLNAKANCQARFAEDRTKSTKLVIGGSVVGTGNAGLRACQTMIYMMNGALPGTAGVAPYANAFAGTISLAGGGAVDWSAPNVSSTAPTAAQLNEFEDLALWTETESGSSISGGGGIFMRGIFFAPNANPFEIKGGGTQEIGRDAQFVVRKLRLTGNAFIAMRPDPANAILVPYFKSFALVR